MPEVPIPFVWVHRKHEFSLAVISMPATELKKQREGREERKVCT